MSKHKTGMSRVDLIGWCIFALIVGYGVGVWLVGW